jgi:hypothetical protein
MHERRWGWNCRFIQKTLASMRVGRGDRNRSRETPPPRTQERVSARVPSASYHNPATLPNQWPLCGGGKGAVAGSVGGGVELAPGHPGACPGPTRRGCLPSCRNPAGIRFPKVSAHSGLKEHGADRDSGRALPTRGCGAESGPADQERPGVAVPAPHGR